MKLSDLTTNLCAYDDRNPEGQGSPNKPKRYAKQCFCDNCFQGRTPLAEYALILLHKLKSL